jgi:hypothetical protein
MDDSLWWKWLTVRKSFGDALATVNAGKAGARRTRSLKTPECQIAGEQLYDAGCKNRSAFRIS